MDIQGSLKYISTDRIEAEIILADILGKDRSFLFAHPEYKLSHYQSKKFGRRLSRRRTGEPLAYILGYKEFYGSRFFVDKRVLIPRQETEDLIDTVIQYAKNQTVSSICDVGTGSGCISVTLAKKLPTAEVYAVDVSKEALQVARRNAKINKVDKKIEFLLGSLISPLPKKVDIIVANLPYIESKNLEKLDSEVKNWEPQIALDGGEDGMKYYNQLFLQSKSGLNKGGKIFYELDGKVHVR